MTHGLIYGAASLGNLYREVSDERAGATLEAAWDAGIRHFDVAPHYGLGLAERRLGSFLATHSREEYVLSTKVGRLLVSQEGSGDDLANGFAVPDTFRREWRADADAVRRSLEESLERLGLDRVDTLYLHDPDESGLELAGAVREGLESLAVLRSEGLVGRIGVGSKSAEALRLAVEGEVRIDEVMCSNRYTLVDRDAAEHVLPTALERGIGVVAVSVYSSGLLARSRPTSDLHDEYGPVRPERLVLANALADVAERHGVDLPTVALQFPRRHPAVVGVAFGTGSPEHVTQSVERWARQVPAALWDEADDVVASGGRP